IRIGEIDESVAVVIDTVGAAQAMDRTFLLRRTGFGGAFRAFPGRVAELYPVALTDSDADRTDRADVKIVVDDAVAVVVQAVALLRLLTRGLIEDVDPAVAVVVDPVETVACGERFLGIFNDGAGGILAGKDAATDQSVKIVARRCFIGDRASRVFADQDSAGLADTFQSGAFVEDTESVAFIGDAVTIVVDRNTVGLDRIECGKGRISTVDQAVAVVVDAVTALECAGIDAGVAVVAIAARFARRIAFIRTHGISVVVVVRTCCRLGSM
ncbi:MAG: hypothetical protein AADX96_00005, partial [Thiocapsa sp. C3-sup]